MLEDSAFIYCSTCRLSFYIELVTEVDEYPLPNHCPFCGAVGSLDDLEAHLEHMDTALKAELRRHQFVVLDGGKTTSPNKEDTNGQERNRDPDVDRHEQGKGGGEGNG